MMPQFSRKSIVYALEKLLDLTQGKLTRFLLLHSLEDIAPPMSSLDTRVTLLTEYLVRNPEAVTQDGDNLTDSLVRELVERAATWAERLGADFNELHPS